MKKSLFGLLGSKREPEKVFQTAPQHLGDRANHEYKRSATHFFIFLLFFFSSNFFRSFLSSLSETAGLNSFRVIRSVKK